MKSPVAYFEPVTEELEKNIYKIIDKTPEMIKDDIETMRKWILSQPHLPQSLNNVQIRCFILIAKGNLEKAKSKIDMYFTMRSLYPEIFDDCHPQSERLLEAKKFMYILAMPKLTFDYTRVLIFRLKDYPDCSSMDPYALFTILLNMAEVRLMEDCCADHTVIFDLEHCKFQHISKVTLSFIKCCYTIGEKALTTKVESIHLINAPKYFDQVIMLVKSVVKPKLGNRIHLHRESNPVLNKFDKKVLPKDYGGVEKSLDELEAQFALKMNEYKEFFDRRDRERVNEHLRPENLLNNDIYGLHGSFKKLDFD